jgi:hypothetical protein
VGSILGCSLIKQALMGSPIPSMNSVDDWRWDGICTGMGGEVMLMSLNRSGRVVLMVAMRLNDERINEMK